MVLTSRHVSLSHEAGRAYLLCGGDTIATRRDVYSNDTIDARWQYANEDQQGNRADAMGADRG